MRFSNGIWVLALFLSLSVWAGPTGTEQKTADDSTTSEVSDPTDALLAGLAQRARTPAEKASVQMHQADLNQAMPVKGIVAMNVAKSPREAVLLRTGMAYSDFGKLGDYKQWITGADNYAVHPTGVTNPSKELYAILQGENGVLWNDPTLKDRKAFYEPLLKMMKDPVINPGLDYSEIIKLPAKAPVFIGYMHEWQGIMLSYLDAQDAIQNNKGPLAGTVRNLNDYQSVFNSIYGHNGSGPSKEEYVAWFKEKFHREPHEKTEIPFWIQAHGFIESAAKAQGIPIFENSIQNNKYAGSVNPNKFSMFHRITDRIDGAIHPEKIYEEIGFLGPRSAIVEAYFGGNQKGSQLLQQYTMERELDRMVENRKLTRQEAETLKEHARNQIELAEKVFKDRAGKTTFFDREGRVIPVDQIGERHLDIGHIDLQTTSGTKRWEFKTEEGPNNSKVEKLVDASGKGEDFMTVFKKEVAYPALEKIKADPHWRAGGDFCGYDAMALERGALPPLFSHPA